MVTELTLSFPDMPNEQGRPMIWIASWLIDDEGNEGAIVHNARGGAEVAVQIPSEAVGLRVRRWPNDGFDAEYADLLRFDSGRVDAAHLDFDSRQPHSLLAEDFGEANPWGLSRYATRSRSAQSSATGGPR